MPVRIRIRIESDSGRSVLTPALINSGYEAEQPELMVPLALAQELGLWGRAVEEYARTPVGIGKVYVVCKRARVQVVTEDRESAPVDVCVLVSEFEREVLISDYLAGELEIAVEDFAEGLWRFRWEPKERVGASARP